MILKLAKIREKRNFKKHSFQEKKVSQHPGKKEMTCDRFVWEPPADDSAAFAEDIRLLVPRTC